MYDEELALVFLEERGKRRLVLLKNVKRDAHF